MSIVCVVGGGSPFTIGLARAMCDQLDPGRYWELRLLGRDPARTRDVACAAGRYFEGRPWTVTATVDLERACRDADVIVHQARIGGHEQRAADEELARMAGLPGDETMGPAGLRAALRIHQPTRLLAERIHEVNDRAPVLVMANPLAVSTRAVWSVVGDRAIGVCEVPLLTEHYLGAARNDDGSPRFGYVGWNHRGFHWFADQDDNRSASPSTSVPPPWADRVLLSRLGAWPAKQFGELSRPQPVFQPRAEAVAEISRQLTSEMSAGGSLPSEALRPTPWYDLAVVPAIKAVTGDAAWLPVTMCLDENHATEQYVLLGADGVQARAASLPVPAEVERWHAAFTRHQHLVDATVSRPSLGAIARTLAADPLLPCNDRAVVSALEASLP